MSDVVKAIAEIIGAADTSNHLVMERICSIRNRLTKILGDEGFKEDVERAAAEVRAQGISAFENLIGSLSNAMEPKEREYKIKRSEKGQRIKVKSASGVQFSFGPIWRDAVRACKGIAINEGNREKLNMHGTHMGVVNPESMSPRELCSAISALM